MKKSDLSKLIRLIGGYPSDILQKVDVPILDNQHCQEWFKKEEKKVVIVDTCLCAGFEQGGKDSCQVFVESII